MSRTSLTKAILFSLENTVDGLIRLEDFSTHTHIYAQGYDRPLKKSALSIALKRLREDGFIEREKDQGLIIYKLTQKGKDKAILYQDLVGDWDGKWRIVIFDIPETKKTVREVFRRKLIEWGFKKWQKSVWASKKNCTDPLREFIKGVGIEDWVLVIESDNVGESLHFS